MTMKITAMMMMMMTTMIIIIITYKQHPIAGRSRKQFLVLLGGEIASLLAEFSPPSRPPEPSSIPPMFGAL